MNSEAIALVLEVYRANAAEDKVYHISQIVEKMQVLEMLVQMSFDLRILSPDNYAQCIELFEGLGKQAGGWKKSSVARNIANHNQPVYRRPESSYVTA